MPQNQNKHAAKAEQHIADAFSHAGANHGKHQQDVSTALSGPVVARLFKLMDQGDVAAGDEQLRATLATILGLCTMAAEHAATAKAPSSPFLAKATAGLTSILAP